MMAGVWPGQKERLYLIQNHCPIPAAATRCQGLCSAEVGLFRKVLGGDVEVAREEHIISGARRFAYRITPRPASSGISQRER